MSHKFIWPTVSIAFLSSLICHPNLAMATSWSKSIAQRPASTQLVAQNAQAVEQFKNGVKLFQNNDLVGAEAAFRRAIELDNTFAVAYANLGSVLVNQQKLEEAIPQFQAAIRLKPELPQLHYQLGLIYYLQNRLPEAIPSLTKARDLLKQQGQTAEAEKVDQALRKIKQ